MLVKIVVFTLLATYCQGQTKDEILIDKINKALDKGIEFVAKYRDSINIDAYFLLNLATGEHICIFE